MMEGNLIVEIVDVIDTTGVFAELSHPKSGGICVFVVPFGSSPIMKR